MEPDCRAFELVVDHCFYFFVMFFDAPFSSQEFSVGAPTDALGIEISGWLRLFWLKCAVHGAALRAPPAFPTSRRRCADTPVLIQKSPHLEYTEGDFKTRIGGHGEAPVHEQVFLSREEVAPENRLWLPPPARPLGEQGGILSFLP